MRRLSGIVTTALVLAIGLIMVLSLTIGSDLGQSSVIIEGVRIRFFATLFLQLTVLIVAVTVLIGVLNLLWVHIRRLRSRQSMYSLILVISFLAVILTRLLSLSDLNRLLLEDVQVPIESALAGLLFISLVYGAARMMHRRVSWQGTLFIFTLLVVLIGALPIGGASVIRRLSDWLLAYPVSAGARGVLIGIALATIVVGVRVLIGQDRSYRE